MSVPSVPQLHCSQVWLMRQFNQGTFGRIHQGILEWNGGIKPVAIKIMKSEKTDDSTSIREIGEMMRFNHPNIVKLVGMVTPGETGHGRNGCHCDSQSDKLKMSWIVMEHFSLGNLLDFLRRPEALPECDMKKIAYEVALGMDYLHTSVNVIHRDLRTHNILMQTHNSIKICDFGISREDNPNKLFPEDQQFICNVYYAAPETMPSRVTRQTPIYTKKMDVWMFGVVLFQIWSRGQDPFHGMKYKQVVNAVFYRKQNVLWYSKPSMCVWVENLMKACFLYNRDDRLDFNYIYQAFGRCLYS